MVTLRVSIPKQVPVQNRTISVRVPIPKQSRKISRRAIPVRKVTRGFETALYDLPVVSRFTTKRSLRRRITRQLDRLSRRQRTVALSVAAFIAVNAVVNGIVIAYRRRQRSMREEAEAASEGGETPDEVLTETIIEEYERRVFTQ